MRLAGKSAVVTGAGAGIGRACAELFAREGARVVIAERDEASGQSLAEALQREGHDCLFVQTDVSEPQSMAAMVERAAAAYGRIDVLYNNAGGSTLQDGPVTSTPFEEFWRKMKVDVFGTWLGCHYVIPHMIAAGGGAIVNASSIYAFVGMPGRDAYTAAKGAITALTRSMAVQYAPHRIRVNAVAAGAVTVERVLVRLQQGAIPQEYLDKQLLGLIAPAELAQSVLHLACDESSKTTGQVLVVDAGYTAA